MSAPELPLKDEEEASADAIVRWIPYVPLGAVLILLGTYVIYAAILMQAA